MARVPSWLAGGVAAISVLAGVSTPVLAQITPPPALMAQANEQGLVRVVVGLGVPAGPEGAMSAPAIEIQRAAIASAQARVTAAVGADSVIHTYQTIPYTAMSLTADQLRTLSRMPGVTSISEDILTAPTLDVSTALIGARAVWRRGIEGTGWNVVVMDTGVNYRHRAFTGSIVSAACFSSNDVFYNSTSLCEGGATRVIGGGAARDCSSEIAGCGHGTHVSGIVTGDFPRAQRGVAPGAGLIPMQVFSRFAGAGGYCSDSSRDCALSFSSDQVAALERVAAMAPYFPIASVNLSLGGGFYTSSCDSVMPSYTAIVDQLASLGVAVVIASGNSYYSDAVSFPACISGAVTVGATDDADAIASFSNQDDSAIDLMAPGVEIEAAYIGGRAVIASLSGTSMAAPHVAGAFALMRQAAPSATVAEILHALQCTGTEVTRVGTTGTFRRINVALARQQLLVNNQPGC